MPGHLDLFGHGAQPLACLRPCLTPVMPSFQDVQERCTQLEKLLREHCVQLSLLPAQQMQVAVGSRMVGRDEITRCEDLKRGT